MHDLGRLLAHLVIRAGVYRVLWHVPTLLLVAGAVAGAVWLFGRRRRG